MNKDTPSDLIHASFFFIDIVGLSNPILSTETQRTKIKILNETIYSCDTFLSTTREELFVLPTGDGMLIGFKDDLEKPIKLAIELHHKLRDYNQSVPSTEKIVTRIGCNIGNIFVVKDVLGNVNLWGPGAILARRVMDLGDDEHILLTATMADDLTEIANEYNKILHPIHNYKIKHNEEILVYNVFGDGFGNPTPPKKSAEGHNINANTTKNAKCQKIICNTRLSNPITNLLKHERIFYFSNNSDEPIYDIKVGIVLNQKKEVQDLTVKVFDEIGELKISRITPLSPFVKELTIKLRQPVFNGDSKRILKVHFESEEPYNYFENIFLTDTETIEFNFIFPYDAKIEPKLHYVDLKDDSEIPIRESKRTSKGTFNSIQWQKNTLTDLKGMIRLEW